MSNKTLEAQWHILHEYQGNFGSLFDYLKGEKNLAIPLWTAYLIYKRKNQMRNIDW